MRVLLVEPNYRRGKPSSSKKINDDTLWYPPIGLLKLSRFHKNRNDDVVFTIGKNSELFSQPSLFSEVKGRGLFDRVYITTLFTFDFDKVIEVINYYRNAIGGTRGKIFIGGVMASLMPEEIFNDTGIFPIPGILTSPAQIGLPGKENIDQLCPDYSILDKSTYAINNTFYAYTTRGCTNACPWCGVPKIEPEFEPYIDIKPIITQLREEVGDLAVLKLMDNNVLASPKLEQIVGDLLGLGYGRGSTTDSHPPRSRVIDFNQGLDASHLNEDNIKLLSKLNIKPMRIAFDKLAEKAVYKKAIESAYKYGFTEFSNYMLFNFKDTPKDLYERLVINIKLNAKWRRGTPSQPPGSIYSYPMRYAPIIDPAKNGENKKRDPQYLNQEAQSRDWLKSPIWTPRFVRNVEIMKGAAHGAITPSPTLAWRTIGETFSEFIANLYMPEELIRNRNRHEKKVYSGEPERNPGTGLVEDFREFILKLLNEKNNLFFTFHDTIIPNRTDLIKKAIENNTDKELNFWFQQYLRK